MKALERLKFWMRRVNTKRLAKARAKTLAADARVRELTRELQNARAHLMEIRVTNEAPRGEIGWMVSAFVPERVVKFLQRHPERVEEYRRIVAEALVKNAMERILKIDKSGKVQALIFENVTNPKQQVIGCRPWFEADTEKAMAMDIERARKLADESERTRRMLW